jgi:hypothetical protein
MRRAFKCLATVCVSLLSLSMSAPVRSPGAECPTITVDCPTQIITPGETTTVTASVAGADPNLKLSYNWSLSAGTIIAGQGTATITIDTNGNGGQTTTATVEVDGLDSSCQKTASCTLAPNEVIVSRRFDKFGDLAFVDEKKRLDYFAEQLKADPDLQGYILVYGKRGARAGEAQARATRAKDYLVTKGGIVAERLVTIDGGDHARLEIELWLASQGAQPPSPLDDHGEPRESN